MKKKLLSILSVLSIFCLSFSLSFFSSDSSAYAAELDFDSAVSYNLSSWDSAPDDLISLADSYVSYCSDIYSSRSQISLDWIYKVGESFCISPRSGLYYYLEDGSLYRYTDSSIAHSSGGGSHSGGSHSAGVTLVSSSDSVEVDSSSFKDYITIENSNIIPKNHFQSKLSYRTDPYWYDDKAPSGSLRFTIYDGSGFCPEHYERTNGVYLLPFYEDGEGMKYFAYYQYHLYFETGTDDNEGKCRVRADIIGLDFAGKSDVVADASFWWFDGTSNHVFGSTYATWTDVNPYFDIGLPFSDKPYLPVSGYINISDYISRSGYTYSVCRTLSNANNEPIGKDSSFPNWISYDKSSTFDFTTVFDSFLCPRSEHSNLYDDIGFIVSSDPIVTQYVDIDVGQLPDNQIITISGDTIYDYSITNPSTGETTTVNNYITNNYTYPEGSGSGDTSGSSGGASTGDVNVGGNVIVGGEIGVNGSVDINVNVPDININVNSSGAGGSGSSIANPDDFTSSDNVDLTKYYDEAVEQSTGFQKFLKDFFGFLPAELLGLILFAVAIAIVCRVFGR